MRNKKLSQNGFAVAEGIIILVIIVIIGFVGWRILDSNKQPASQNAQQTTTSNTNQTTTAQTESPKELIWQQTESGWQPTQTPPACPSQPMLKMPADITKVTGILYPGQTRGTYKPHGGFRFDTTSDNATTVKAPIDGFIVKGTQYMAEGEVQYGFDVMNNCGVMFRVGHLRELPENLQKLTTTWPAPMEGDSRNQRVEPAVYVKQGDVMGTKVGIIKDKNTFFDLGIYDYRQDNEASKSPSYQQAHAQDKELSWHAVCWFDWMPKADAAKIKSLPAGDPSSGKKSDYCTG